MLQGSTDENLSSVSQLLQLAPLSSIGTPVLAADPGF